MSVLVELFAALLAPHHCAACDARVSTVFCPRCASTLVRTTESHAKHVAPFAYGGALADAIARLKYGDRPDLARPLGDLLRSNLSATRMFSPDVVVPVPLHPARLATRGFNQAALLAAPVARELGVPHRPRALARVVDTAKQVDMDRDARTRNVRDAFKCRDRGIVGQRVVLVDDVRTTGATLKACAETLLAAGAKDVATLVLAVAEDENTTPS